MSDSASETRYFRDGVAVVTGAASGIGSALCEALAREGCNVVLVDLQGELASGVAKEVAALGVTALCRSCDVRDAAGIAAVVEETSSRFGRLDFMFNNAGIVIQGEVQEHGVEDWDRIVDINLKGVIYGIAASYGIMQQQGFGHIVNTASLAGLIPTPMLAGYSATKHAVVGLTRVLRAEGAARGVRASAVCPGQVRTPIMTGGRFGRVIPPISEEVRRDLAERTALMEPRVLVTRVLRQVRRNRALIVEPRSARWVARLDRHFPRTFDRIAIRAFRRMQRETEEAIAASRRR